MKRLNRLGYKLFSSFTLILFILGGLVFHLFQSVQNQEASYQYMAKNAMLIKLLLEEDGLDGLKSRKTLEIIGSYGRSLAWVAAEPGGEILARSFDGDIPPEARNLEGYRSWAFDEARVYLVRGGETEALATVPLTFAGQPATLYLTSRLREKNAPDQVFLRGLAPVLLAGVVLVFLVSWFISRPLRRVRKAVTDMAGGDLSARIMVDSADELGELSLAFNRMAESLERIIRGNRGLMANVSHQLRTPLTRMRLSVELLREAADRVRGAGQQPEGGQDVFRRHLGLLRDELGRMDELIGRILLLSRLDLKEKPLQLTPGRVDSLLEDLTRGLGALLEAGNLRLEARLRELPEANIDADALSVALENLLDNAVKYTPPGGAIRVLADFSESSALSGKPVLRLEIANTCPALSPETLEDILKPFRRGSGTRAQGSGLGLPISKRVIEEHGGRLSLRSDEAGFAVIVELPALYTS